MLTEKREQPPRVSDDQPVCRVSLSSEARLQRGCEIHRDSWSPPPRSYFLKDAGMPSFKKTGTSMQPLN